MKKDIKPMNFDIEGRSAMPVYKQVKQEIKLLIMSGYLVPGDQLVPIRELAGQLRINANTIVKVYYQLDIEGFIYSQPGTGYFVSSDREEPQDEKRKLFEQISEDYINKSLKLGFSLDDMTGFLKERAKSTGKKSIKKQAKKKVTK
ncbi:MAG: GntR family transcriptional regulator [bacterium]|nr:GntR family transcriptional regulator [bacterium]